MGKLIVIRDPAQFPVEVTKLMNQLIHVGEDICSKAGNQTRDWIKNYLMISNARHNGTLITSIKAGKQNLGTRVYIESPADKYAPQIDSKEGLLPNGMWVIFDADAFARSQVQGSSKLAENPASLRQWVMTKDGLDEIGKTGETQREFFFRVGAVFVGAGNAGVFRGHPTGLHFWEGGFKFATDPKKLVANYYAALSKQGLSGGVI